MATNKITLKAAAEARQVSKRRLQVLCGAGRIRGAEQLDNGTWLVPENFKVTKANPKRRQLEKLA
jgi:hypothetical protein